MSKLQYHYCYGRFRSIMFFILSVLYALFFLSIFFLPPALMFSVLLVSYYFHC